MTLEQNELKSQVKKLPMKWHKFYAYFFVYASALWYLVNGIAFFTQNAYGAETEHLYKKFAELRNLDIFVGIFMITLALFAVFVGVRLVKLKKDAIVSVIVLYGMTITASIFYLVRTNAVIPYIYLGYANLSTYWMLIFASVIFIIANAVYFYKRKHLFVN